MERASAASTRTGAKGKRLARASWVTFLAVVVGNGVLASKLPIVTDLLALAGAAVGVALGALALARIDREGREGILRPALAGALLNGLLVLIWVTNFLASRARHG